jgi:hypothetical protein
MFVGLEMRQSRQIAIADLCQQRAAMVIQTWSGGKMSELAGANHLHSLLMV